MTDEVVQCRDRTTLLLLMRKRSDNGTSALTATSRVVAWVTYHTPYWVISKVCGLLGDWQPDVCFGLRTWRVNGKLHRVHGPAIVHVNGEQFWYRRGEIHRDGDAPAHIGACGTRVWWQCGKMHRDGDAPALIHADGTQHWCRHGKLHRDGDMPAVITADGVLEWWRDGELHRDGGAPAIITADGRREWYVNGERYHGNGRDIPAITYA